MATFRKRRLGTCKYCNAKMAFCVTNCPACGSPAKFRDPNFNKRRENNVSALMFYVLALTVLFLGSATAGSFKLALILFSAGFLISAINKIMPNK